MTLLVLLVGVSAAAAQTASPRDRVLVSAGELAAHAKDADLLILHVADRQSTFDEEHIPGARLVQYGDIAVDGNGLGSELPPVDALDRVLEAVGVSDNSRIVVYSTSTVMAARLFFTLDVLGHPRVALLDGGLRAWKAEGRPTARGSEPARGTTGQPERSTSSPGTANRLRQGSGESRRSEATAEAVPSENAVPNEKTAPRDARFSPRLNTERLAGAQWIQLRASVSQISLVDVRPDPEFTGSDGGMGGAHVAGHIAGARQLPWNTLVDESGRFLPAADLRAKLDAIGIARDKPVVSYCMVGMRASVVYFVARYLGYDARLYDGSIVDWGRRGLPTVKGR